MCSHPHHEDRPSMRELVQMLADDKPPLVIPFEPPSQDTSTTSKRFHDFIVSFSSYKHGSSNTISHASISLDGKRAFTPDGALPFSMLEVRY